MPKHNGHKYEIIFCDPSTGQWGEAAGMFLVDGDSNAYPTYSEAKQAACDAIDEWVSNVPQTKDEWLDAFCDCVEPEGYSDFSIDRTRAWELLVKASKHLKDESEDE